MLTVTEQKLTDSRKRVKILADNRKSHHPIESLLQRHIPIYGSTAPPPPTPREVNLFLKVVTVVVNISGSLSQAAKPLIELSQFFRVAIHHFSQ